MYKVQSGTVGKSYRIIIIRFEINDIERSFAFSGSYRKITGLVPCIEPIHRSYRPLSSLATMNLAG